MVLWLVLRRAGAYQWAGYWLLRAAGLYAGSFWLTGALSTPVAHAAQLFTLASVAGGHAFLLLGVWNHTRPSARWRWARRIAWYSLALFAVGVFFLPADATRIAALGHLVTLIQIAPVPLLAVLSAVLVAHARQPGGRSLQILAAAVVLTMTVDVVGASLSFAHLGTAQAVARPEWFLVLQLLVALFLSAAAFHVLLAEERSRMERLVSERVHEAHFEQLGHMASGVAHDFNNVLAVIQLAAEAAASEPQTAMARDDLATVATAGAKGRDLVASLLAYARRHAATTHDIDLHALLRDIARVLEKLVGIDRRFVLDLAEGPSPVHVDSAALVGVLTNLVANARDATEAGGTVRITTTVERAGARPNVCLRVSDTGTGIPADVLPHIFEPYYSTKGDTRGTGLGLAMARTVVKSAGGTIRVESSEGRGTTMEVVLPLVSGAAESETAQTGAR